MITRNGSMMMGSSMYYRVCSTTLQGLEKPRNGSHSRGIADFATSIIHPTSFNGHLFPKTKLQIQIRKNFFGKNLQKSAFLLDMGPSICYNMYCNVEKSSIWSATKFPKNFNYEVFTQ